MQSYRVQQAFPIGDGETVKFDAATGLNGPVRSSAVVRVVVSSKRFCKFSATPDGCANDGSEEAMLVANTEYFFENSQAKNGENSRKFICFSVAIVPGNDNVVQVVNK
jgi:hypothetical protein